MDVNLRRRRFLQTASALGLGAGLGHSAGLLAITPARAEDMAVGPDAVRYRPEIEPVVRWIEETPRDRILDSAVDQLKRGLSYRELLAGLFLAGIRNVKPRPVGFKFHTVMVINSAHVLGQTAPVEDRLMPLFWALDTFKNSQAQDVKEGDWTLNKVDEAHVPSPSQARDAFDRAMQSWDSDAADTAVAALCRSAGAAETMEAFWRFAVRDQRNIGHKPIFAMQCWRTLQAIGWPHAEPVLRSLAYGMLDLQGDKTAAPVGPYESNLERAKTVRDDWAVGKADAGATRALLDAIRSADPEGVSAEVARLLNDGVAPQSLWDAVALGANELLVQSPGILAIHAVTATNALHYIAGASGDDTTRKLALLQAAGWQPLYRARVEPKGGMKLDAPEPIEPEASGDDAVLEIFETIAESRSKAAAKALGYLQRGGSPAKIFATARSMIFTKGRDSHDYKYGAAAWEEYLLASPQWQPALVAATMGNLPAAGTPDSPLMQRARRAIERVGEPA